MTVAEYVARFLRAQGVTTVFGVPGGENVPLIEALRAADVTYLLMHHEADAGYAADVAGQAAGVPGVCMSTVGPGAVNLAAAAAAATLERSPVLAITAEIDTRWQGKVQHMAADLPALFGAVTKGSFRLTAADAAETLADAWQLARAAPRGAVHVALAPDVARQSIVGSPPGWLAAPAAGSADTAALDAARARLTAAQAPFILAGVGVEAAAAHGALLALAQRLDAPVAVTPKTKGHFPESHPLFAGVFTAYGDESLRRALASADLIVGVGLDSADFVTSVWEPATPLVHVTEAASDPAFDPVVTVTGPLGETVAALAAAMPDEDRLAHGAGRAADIRAAIAARLVTPAPPPTPPTVRLLPLIDGLRAALPDNGAVTVDVGAFKLVFLQRWFTDRPQTVFVANGLSAMGYAVPGALALRQRSADQPIVAVAGDGALLMYAGELATIGRLGVPLVILVVVDEALSLIRLKQLRSGVPVYGTEFGRTDYAALARAFGLAYRRIEGEAAIATTLTDALALGRPVLVEAVVDNAEYDHFR